MLFYYHIKNLIRLLIPLTTFIFISCAYFNTFYNAKESFENAKRIIDNKKYTETDLPVEAKKFLDEAIINSKIVLDKYPDTRWVENAYFIIASSLLFKEDIKGSKKYFTSLTKNFPKSKYNNESMLWLSLCEFKLGNFEAHTSLISNFTENKIKLNKNEKFIFKQILAEISMVENNTESVYKYLNASLEFASNDSEKVKIYNKLITFSDLIEDYINLVVYLDKLYNLLENERERKDIKLLAIDYHKKLDNYDYLIPEIERLLSLSSFNDKRLFLTLELGKIYFQMKDYSTAKEILYSIISDNSKKKETSEAYYLLAKINMHEVFEFTVIKELLEKSKDEKSSSKPGKLSKKTISKIEDLEDLIYEYDLSTNEDSANVINTLRSDSLLFYIAETFYFDFNNSDSSIYRYKELIQKYPNSNPYTPMSLYALSWIDSTNIHLNIENSTWSNIAKSTFPDYSINNVSSEEYISKLLPVLKSLNTQDYKSAYTLLDDILLGDTELNFYRGLLNELYSFNANKMLKHYIDYANQELGNKNLETVKEKLSSYYYIMNEDVKYLKTKQKISDCSRKIINKTNLDSIYVCFEEINTIDDYYSFDSVKVRIEDVIPGSPSSFKRNMSHFDVKYNEFQATFRYIKDNMVVDSTYSIDNFEDSLLVVIRNSIINLDTEEALNDVSKINQLDAYLLMFDNLDIIISNENSSKDVEDINHEPFRDLNLENLDIDKLKLNLTK